MAYSEYGISAPEGLSSNYYTTCPICSEHRKKKNDKCLTIYPSEGNEGKFHCHHCGSYGYKDSGWWYTNPDYGGTGESAVARAAGLRSGQENGDKVKKNYTKPPELPKPTEDQANYKKVFEFFQKRSISWTRYSKTRSLGRPRRCPRQGGNR